MRGSERVLFWIAVILSMGFAIASLCISLARQEEKQLNFDYQGAIVAIFSLLVTVLIGWNIIQYLDADRRINRFDGRLNGMNARIDNMANNLATLHEARISALETNIREIIERNARLSIRRDNLYGIEFSVATCLDLLELLRKDKNNKSLHKNIKRDIVNHIIERNELIDCDEENFLRYAKLAKELKNVRLTNLIRKSKVFKEGKTYPSEQIEKLFNEA